MNESVTDFQIFGVTGYTVMSNYHLQDKNLSIRAKGLLSLMLSLPKDWDYSINGLVTLSIDEYRDTKGHFKYKYSVYYLPYPKWLEMSKLTGDGFTASVRPETVKPKEQNNNNKKDKIDKTPEDSGEQIKHNILTKELIRRNYISDDDASSFLFDQLFEDLLLEGNDYRDLFNMTNYIILKTKERDFKDENNNEISNRFGYFKNSLISNINKFKNMPDSIYESDDDYDWLNDMSEDKVLDEDDIEDLDKNTIDYER